MKSIIFAALLASCTTLAHAQDALTYPGATLAGRSSEGSTSTANSGSSALNVTGTPGGGFGHNNLGPMSIQNANPDSAVKSGVIQDTTSTLSLSRRR